MAFTFALGNRVRETSTTTGTGAYALAGAVSGFRTFASAIGNSNYVLYVATMGTQWEVGLGIVNTAGPSLSRDVIEASSSSDSAVNWSAGTKEIRGDFSARHLQRLFVGGPIWCGNITESGSAITMTPVPPLPINYWPGMTVYGITDVSFTMDVSAPTLNVSGKGAVTVKRWGGGTVPAIGGSQLLSFVYDGGFFRISQGS